MNYQQRKKVEARRRALEAQLEAEEPTNLDALEDLRQVRKLISTEIGC